MSKKTPIIHIHSLCVKDRDSHADSESVDQVVDVNPMPKLKDGEVPVENWIVDGKSYEKWIKNGINSSTWYPFKEKPAIFCHRQALAEQ